VEKQILKDLVLPTATSFHDPHDLALHTAGRFHDPHNCLPRTAGAFHEQALLLLKLVSHTTCSILN
jgi:hypothetical protein